MTTCIQIGNLLQAYIDDELSASERLLFEEHVNGCPACAREVHATRSCSARLFRTLGGYRLTEDLSDAVMAHLPEMEPLRLYTPVPRNKALQPQHMPARLWFGTAMRLMPVFAPVILAVLALLLWSTWPSGSPGGTRTLGVVTYREGHPVMGHVSHLREARVRLRDVVTDGQVIKTPADGRVMVGLLGPSHLTLYGNAAVHIASDREITVERGRCFLDVYRDTRQFRVNTPDGRITVMGTSFHVDVRENGTEVTVVNGKVLVENETSFAVAARGDQVLIAPSEAPALRSNVAVAPFLAEARAIRPDAAAERYFLSRLLPENPVRATSDEQVFIVDTRRRAVSALILKWTPDPYTSGHAGYNVYVADSSMRPLFKSTIGADIFREKNRSSLRISVPENAPMSDVGTLHITLMPERGAGGIETTFAEVSAIGIKQ